MVTNIHGREIHKGPKGGEYVLVAGKKVYKFKRAPVYPSSLPGAKSSGMVANILSSGTALRTPNRPGLTKTNFIYRNRKVYKKDASGRYYAIAPGETKGFSITLKEHVKKAGMDVSKPLKNWLKAPPAPAPMPSVSGSPPAPAGYEKTPYMFGSERVYKKTSSGRYWVVPSTGATGHSMLDVYTVKNTRTGESKTLGEFKRGTKAKPKPKPTGPTTVAVSPSSGKLPTPSPRPVIATAERNRRLAEIRARLNAIKAKRLANMPKTRKNVEQKLRLAYWRARARRDSGRNSLAGVPTKNIKIGFWHAPAKVPRASLSARSVTLKVYTGSNPLIDSGGVVAMQEKDFDLEWFKRQNTYISKLSDYDFWTVQAHTNRSHSWIGLYTYKGTISRFDALGPSIHIRPLWPQIRKMILNGTYRDNEKWVKDFKNETDEKKRYDLYSQNITRMSTAVKKAALEMYKKDLKRIIAGAPRVKKKMILYRGSNFDIFNGIKGHWYKLRSFCSAAYNVDWATGYGSSGFTRVTVLPDTPVLLVAGTNQWSHEGEYEVMVNIDTQYLIRTRGVKRHVYKTSGTHDNYYRVTDVIIAK